LAKADFVNGLFLFLLFSLFKQVNCTFSAFNNSLKINKIINAQPLYAKLNVTNTTGKECAGFLSH
jgi:hypothetical protein